ncbi:MAG: tail fiber domain-containing protein [Candidatus Udaeobacter sp.]
MKTRIQSILIVITLLLLGLLPQVQAVSPAPDGCYTGFTTAEGCNALKFLTTGLGNTGIGWYSLYVNTTGSFNTGVGGGALALNNADSNTAVGAAALLLNTTGTENVAVGTDALVYNDTGSRNSAFGAFALFNNTTGVENTAIGGGALSANTEGLDNVATGFGSLSHNTTGGANTADGSGALFNNTTGDFNTAFGQGALQANTTGNANVALGVGAGGSVTTAENVICIGATVSGANVSNRCYIGNIRSATTGNNNAIPVLIDSAGQLGTISSSRRFKKEIKPMDKASEVILALKPVTFHYKSDNTNRPEFGLIAEQVAKVNPDLVVRDESGEIYTVRYDAVNAMLLNEFLKEHRRVQEQQRTIAQQRQDFEAAIARQRKDFEATITELKKGMATVTVRLNEQAAQIQKVNTQMEISKPVVRMALSNP